MNYIKIKPIIKGIMTFFPGTSFLFPKKLEKVETNSARYCYGVWLKHLTLSWNSGFRKIPETVAEIGPGTSIGVGLAALLSGANTYYALDVVKSTNIKDNLNTLDKLIKLFRTRAGRPKKGWPTFDKHLNKDLFPSDILTEEVLNISLSQKRIDSIKRSIINPNSQNDITIKYIVPWDDPQVIPEGSLDMLFSHAVLEHVNDLSKIYQAFASWLRTGGYMSHQIDFKSHGVSNKWNGHWAYTDFLWKITTGKRHYLINRYPCSAHIDIIRKNGFKIALQLKRRQHDGINRNNLSSCWKYLSDDDLSCSGTFIQAQKI